MAWLLPLVVQRVPGSATGYSGSPIQKDDALLAVFCSSGFHHAHEGHELFVVRLEDRGSDVP